MPLKSPADLIPPSPFLLNKRRGVHKAYSYKLPSPIWRGAGGEVRRGLRAEELDLKMWVMDSGSLQTGMS